MSEEDERNPTAIRAGSPMDTDEGTIHKFTTKSKRNDTQSRNQDLREINQFNFSFVRQSRYM